jgi:hypothetical protein
MKRAGSGWLTAAFVVLLIGVSSTRPVEAVATIRYPDLQGLIPTGDMLIYAPAGGPREFRYTHDIANLGDGALEIRPQYDSVKDAAQGFQRLYQADGNGPQTLAAEVPIVGQMAYHAAHGHYHYPLAAFGLYQVAADGSRGAAVALSPKVGFCIGDSIMVTPGAGPSTHSGGNCSDPTKTLGITLGWADDYNYVDAGQSIPIDGLANGTYWFHSVVDPDNFLLEKDETNNITDVKVTITGNSVVPGVTTHPSSQPPSVTLTSPATGTTVAGAVPLAATAADAAGIAGVDFLVDGVPVGPPDTSAPYEATWDAAAQSNGSHFLAARATTTAGLKNTSPAATVTVFNSNPSGGLALDASVSVDGRGPVTSPAFSTFTAGETVLALVASDGPGGAESVTVSGGGLAWSLVRRANGQPGSSEVWKATAAALLTNARVTSTQASGSYDQSLSVVSFQNSGGVGLSAAASAVTGAPSVSLVTSQAGTWVFGVGNDWEGAVTRSLPSDQALVHQWVDSGAGDTLWAQRTQAPSPAAGTTVNLRAISPTNHRWNLAAVEIVPAGPRTPGPVLSSILVTDRTATSAQVTWTTDVPSTSSVDYGTVLSYGSAAPTPADPNPVTNHSVALAGLTPDTQYHYRVVSTDAAADTTRSVDHVFTTAAVSTLTCTITLPAAGSTVSGTVSVSANASSTASVSGVQFTVDGTNLGAEDTSTPYSVGWITTSTTNGTHSLTAIARDPTGASITAIPVTVTVSNITPPPPPPPPPPPGPVAAYSFNQGTGTTVSDSSGRNNNGTLAGAAWATAGRYGAALTFNGSNARVDVPDSASLDLTTGMTLEAWVRPTTTNASWRTVLLKERGGGLAYSLYSQTAASRPAGYVNLGGGDVELRATAALVANTWVHLAVTYDGTTMRIYRNGVLVATRAVTGAVIATTGALRIGGNAVWGEYFAGSIDEVRIYDRALTATELTSDMNTPI